MLAGEDCPTPGTSVHPLEWAALEAMMDHFGLYIGVSPSALLVIALLVLIAAVLLLKFIVMR